MSESPLNVTKTIVQLSKNSDLSISEKSTEKRKLNLSKSEDSFSHQKTLKYKLLGKVKSWSSKDHHLNDKCVNSVELDLAKSLSKLEMNESEHLSSNLTRARDSLDTFLKDEQNMPKSSLEKSIFHPKPKNIPDSPKSSPQLGENFKASTSKTPLWDPYERKSKKNRKDIKKKNQSPRNENNHLLEESNKTSIMKKEVEDQTEEANSKERMEEETYKFKYLPKNSKSVVFTNEVLVVYFNNEDVVGEEKEPLKKEVEQQTRNKEMRRVHLNKTQEKYNLCLF